MTSQRAGRLREHDVIADEHPHGAEVGGEDGEAVSGRLGPGLHGGKMDLVILAEDLALSPE